MLPMRFAAKVGKSPASMRPTESSISVEKVVKAIRGDCRRLDLRKAAGVRRADRVILGYIPEKPEFVGGYGAAWEFLPKAIELSKAGAAVHLHALARRGAGRMPELPGFEVRDARRVKSYGPETYHIVVDLIRLPSPAG